MKKRKNANRAGNPIAVSPAFLALAVACIAWLLYARTLTADFVYDARAKVLDSDFIHNPANLPDVLDGRVITRNVLDNNRPSNLLSLMIDAALWGKRAAGYHLTSITMHAAVCAMLFLLLVRLLPAPDGTWPALLAALAYAVHPLNCEAVSEVSYREDLIVAATMLGALFAAMAFLRQPGWVRNFLFGGLCCLLLLIGVAAKENGIAGPVVLACYWLLWRRHEPQLPWLCLLACAFLVVCGFLAALNLRPAHSFIFTEVPQPIWNSAAALPQKAASWVRAQPRIWAMEFQHIILPLGLAADYNPYSIRNFALLPSLIAVALVIAAQIYLAFRHRLYAFGSVIFWAGLLPVSNLIPIYRAVADRFFYLPLIGVAALLAQALFAARHLPGQARAIVFGSVIVGICAFAFVTFQREAVWHDSLTLWSDSAARNPYSGTAADNLGWALLESGRNAEAAKAFQWANRLVGGAGAADPLAGLALAEDALGEHALADQDFRRAAALDARYAHPRELVSALVIEQDVADKLDVLVRRNN